MELKLVELGDHLALLSTDNEEVEIKNNIDIKVEIFLNDTIEIVSLKTLETFHNFIKNVLDFSIIKSYITIDGVTYNLDLTFFSELETKTDYYGFTYESERHKLIQGLSDYEYIKDYMPKWSTAYKNYLSSHGKLVEPFFTDIAYNLKQIQKYIENDVIFFEFPEGDENLAYSKYQEYSVKILEKNITDVKEYSDKIINDIKSYNLKTSKNVDYTFLYFKDLYIKLNTESQNVAIQIEGIYNSNTVKEIVYLDSTSWVQLNFKYDKISRIEFIPYSTNSVFIPDDIEISISNHIVLENFNYLNKDNISYINNKIIKNKETFSVPLSNPSFVFIEEDYILIGKNNSIYTSKLDLKINLDIPQNITYNNNEFIEYDQLDESTYKVDIFIQDYINYSESELISIKINDSGRKTYYLDETFQLVESEDMIFISKEKLNKKKLSMNLSSTNTSDYLVVSVEDYIGKFPNSILITSPVLELIKTFNLESNEKIIYLNNNLYLLKGRVLSKLNWIPKTHTYTDKGIVLSQTYKKVSFE